MWARWLNTEAQPDFLNLFLAVLERLCESGELERDAPYEPALACVEQVREKRDALAEASSPKTS